jgi:hypothetical protein
VRDRRALNRPPEALSRPPEAFCTPARLFFPLPGRFTRSSAQPAQATGPAPLGPPPSPAPGFEAGALAPPLFVAEGLPCARAARPWVCPLAKRLSPGPGKHALAQRDGGAPAEVP